jgi:hypothetical protein
MRLVRNTVKEETSKREDEEFRVVQVPASYTIRHLHHLLFYLFEEQFKKDEGERNGRGHLFKVMKKIVLEGDGEKGDKDTEVRKTKIKDGIAWVRLSSVRDEEEEEEEEGEEEGESGEWRWESEDDFKVNNIWPVGLDLERGLIYVRVERFLSCERICLNF